MTHLPVVVKDQAEWISSFDFSPDMDTRSRRRQTAVDQCGIISSGRDANTFRIGSLEPCRDMMYMFPYMM